MLKKPRSNAVLVTAPVKEPNGNIIGIRLALANGSAKTELMFQDCHAAVLNKFLYEGAVKRLGDAAAAKAGTPMLKRFEPVARLADHYRTGTPEWALKIDHAAVQAAAKAKAVEQRRQWIVEAVAAAAGVTYEQARKGLVKRATALSLPLGVIIDAAMSSEKIALEFTRAEAARAAAAAAAAEVEAEFNLEDFDFSEEDEGEEEEGEEDEEGEADEDEADEESEDE